MDLGLADKVVLVTGASGALGRATITCSPGRFTSTMNLLLTLGT